MSNLQYTVFEDATVVAVGDPIQEGLVAITATSLQSDAIVGEEKNRSIRLFALADCYVTWGSNPTALDDGTEGRILNAGNPEYFSIKAGDKIAVIERV